MNIFTVRFLPAATQRQSGAWHAVPTTAWTARHQKWWHVKNVGKQLENLMFSVCPHFCTQFCGVHNSVLGAQRAVGGLQKCTEFSGKYFGKLIKSHMIWHE